MMNDDLSNVSSEELAKLPLKELVALQDKLKVAIDKRRKNEKSDLYVKVVAIASESGFSTADLVDLVNKAPKTPKKVLIAKYRNPSDENAVWSGKGRKPLWVVKAISEGKTLADLAI